MSSGTDYADNDFSLYSILKPTTPESPPCQSDTLCSISEDVECDVKIDGLAMTVPSRFKKACTKMIAR
ncbi:hypothetical protein MJO28_011578 [Puccinia striiformis f. sp. tritici]|uniref:Uncharacterized protein n=2 Tax=Puccinia striiformis TaxID=27350 RepID=A0A2S4VUB5_9BASI|nr:hypothetical protein MJO28_011578 [Puccinia striiformis f. sp. tritici]KAI7946818.1 hypothetical protein MJO29_011345 [Puccinia striiformis f. sp. tritici]KAI9599717.1 hypothetical protein KEM48_008933 [Puccinia striiformis f. sp. tritici PST-130]POW13057.1 hypothetical protein PSTT_04040 [Puccinia striiformis]